MVWSEDDVDLDSINEWTLNSLEITINRSFTAGRFNLLTSFEGPDMFRRGSCINKQTQSMDSTDVRGRRSLLLRKNGRSKSVCDSRMYVPQSNRYNEKIRKVKTSSSRSNVRLLDESTDEEISRTVFKKLNPMSNNNGSSIKLFDKNNDEDSSNFPNGHNNSHSVNADSSSEINMTKPEIKVQDINLPLEKCRTERVSISQTNYVSGKYNVLLKKPESKDLLNRFEKERKSSTTKYKLRKNCSDL